MTQCSFYKQQGISLIELMISILLGMVLMGAALQVMLSNSRTYQLNDDISRIQENGRIAMDILVKDLRLGGYRRPLNGDGKVPDFFLKECTNTSGAAAPCAAQGAGTASDTLSVQFDPPPDDGTETNCLGETVPATDIIVNVYTVEDIDGDGINSLYCRGYNATTESWTSASAQPLVDGIDNMQVLYGVAGSAVNPSSTTKYVSLDQLNTSDWPNVRSVRVGLLVSNGLTIGSGTAKSRSYRVLDSGVINTAATDNQIRRIYSTTVQFNNTSL